MKKVDLWASDSDELPSSSSATANGSTENYKALYLAEVQRRKALEEIVAKQEIEIRKLKSQLPSIARPISLSSLQSDSEDDLFGPVDSNKSKISPPDSPPQVTSKNVSSAAPLRAVQPMSTTEKGLPPSSIPQSLSRPLSPMPDPRWDELALAEQERRKQARRGKTKSIRLPLKAAVQQLAGKPLGSDEPPSQSTESLAYDATAATAAASTALDAVDEIAESLEDTGLSVEKKPRAPKKRAVRHDTNLRRLNIKSVPRDFGSLASKLSVTPLESVPETRPHSMQDRNERHRGSGMGEEDAREESEDSGWSSGEEAHTAASPATSAGATPAAGTASHPVPPAATTSTAPSSSSSSSRPLQTTSSPGGEPDLAEVDALLINWARGKRLVDLLNTVHEIAPAESIPPQPLLCYTSPSADIRRNYLRTVRYCHPDKVTLNKSLSWKEQVVLGKVFTVLSDSYAAFAAALS